MSILNLQQIQFRYPSQLETLLNDISFTVHAGAKIGLIGNNGSGKSTLLRLIRGEIKQNSGYLSLNASKTAYLPQQIECDQKQSLLSYCWQANNELYEIWAALQQLGDEISADEAVLFNDFYEAGGYTYEARITESLEEFGFPKEQHLQPIAKLSGGERTKLGLAALMLQQPDLILLDEPSNHLDATTVEWLKNFLQHLKIAFILISHSRYLLNECVNEIIVIEKGISQHFSGNYDFYVQATKEQQAQQLLAYQKQKKKVRQLHEAAVQREQWTHVKQKHTRSVTKTGRVCKRDDGSLPASKGILSKQTAAVRKRMQLMVEKEEANKPFLQKKRKLHLEVEKDVKTDQVLKVEALSMRFANRTLFKDVSFVLKKGERLAISGINGSGKTTLLRLLQNPKLASTGDVEWSPQAKLAYYSQLQNELSLKQSAIENCRKICSDETLIRTTLGQLFLTPDIISKPVQQLSYGERAKVALAKVLLMEANVLILDEPGNHLEINARQALQEALEHYQGTLIFVSHDKYFKEHLATREIELNPGAIKQHLC